MIDVHAHYLSRSLLEKSAGGEVSVAVEDEDQRLVFPSGPTRPIRTSLMDLDARREWNRERSIEVQVLSPWMDATGDDLNGASARAWCALYNDTLADDISSLQSFRGMAALPVSDGELSAVELERSVVELGFVGGAIPSQVNGLDLDKAGLDPLFEASQALDVPLFIHPFRVMSPGRMDRHFLSNVCGNPFETTVAALRLFFGGTFDTWPDLKLILAHAGGVLTVVAGRAAHASNHASGFDRGLSGPAEILEVFYYDALLHDPAALAFAIGAVGANRLVAGTDAPFPMLIDDPLGHIRSSCKIAGADEGAVERISHGTASEILRIGSNGSGSH